MKKTTKWVPVASGAISRIAYNSGAHELYVEFKGGSLYTYTKVAGYAVYRMLKADSAGEYFKRVIKTDDHPVFKGVPNEAKPE